MIAGLDSAQPPMPGQVAAARAAGVRLWSGYLATSGAGGSAFGLLRVWTRAEFEVARLAGSAPIAFCSGWDDPAACRELAATWNVRLCLDVEAGIRADGPWVQSWLDASGAGLYGVRSVHDWRWAAFHVAAWYPGSDPGASWPVGWTRPDGPLGWQWLGDHQEVGAEVDRGWYDDWLGGGDADMILVTAPDGSGHILFGDGTLLGPGFDSAATGAQFQAAGLGSTGPLDADTWAKLQANDQAVRTARQASVTGTLTVSGTLQVKS